MKTPVSNHTQETHTKLNNRMKTHPVSNQIPRNPLGLGTPKSPENFLLWDHCGPLHARCKLVISWCGAATQCWKNWEVRYGMVLGDVSGVTFQKRKTRIQKKTYGVVSKWNKKNKNCQYDVNFNSHTLFPKKTKAVITPWKSRDNPVNFTLSVFHSF